MFSPLISACGVLETIRISAAGYPSRRSFEEFTDRYYLLLRSKDWSWDNTKAFTTKVVEKIVENKDKYQVGLTKVFFRTGVIAKLEMLRTERYKEAGLLLQKCLRRYTARQKFLRLKKATIMLQRLSRGLIARKLAQAMRADNAATTIQRHVRGYLARKKYQKQRHAAIVLQSGWRARKARLELRSLRENVAATKIQSAWRGLQERRRYAKARKQIIMVQCITRRRAAKKILKKLKLEARDVGRFKERANLLEKKVFELSQKLKDRDDFKAELTSQITHMESQVAAWKQRAATAEVRVR
ncbi:Unconventional myosin-Va [Gonapodya sp. JEL0774]|nr:Unconventional myosin-Va [Gonapodya sp. JEL0774]